MVTKMKQANIGPKLSLRLVASGLAIFVVGLVLTVILWWFFGGFGFWELPGVTVLFIGVAEILYKTYVASIHRKGLLLRMGLILAFIGLAGYVSFANYYVYGTFQLFSVIAAVFGIVLLMAGSFLAHKT
jgi:hypothetical protein